MRIIYGAGQVARHLLVQYKMTGISVNGIAVTDMEGNPNKLLDVEVHEISHYADKKEDVLICIGVSHQYEDDVISLLEKKGFEHVLREHFVPLYYSNFANVTKEQFLQYWYFYRTGCELDWNNLKSFNEKIQWLKLYDMDDIKRRLSDKCDVRGYVAEIVGEEYLIPLLGIWDHYDDIDFDELPSKFVLKCNHGSGYNIIVRDKNKLQHDKNRNLMEQWLNTDYSDILGLEMQYSGMKPRILCEELLEIEGKEDIPDYKLFVFGGTVKLIQVDIDRNTGHKRNLYTPDWQYLPVSIKFPTAPEVVIPKPQKLEEMISIAERLGKGFIHVRVDLYYLKERIYFGELTFTHGSGQEKFKPESFNYEVGKWIKIKDLDNR